MFGRHARWPASSSSPCALQSLRPTDLQGGGPGGDAVASMGSAMRATSHCYLALTELLPTQAPCRQFTDLLDCQHDAPQCCVVCHSDTVLAMHIRNNLGCYEQNDSLALAELCEPLQL